MTLLKNDSLVHEEAQHPSRSLIKMMETGSDSDVLARIKNGEGLNEQNERGQTPLMIAVSKGRDAWVRALLRNKADTRVKDRSGWTALMYACQNESYVKDLIQHDGKDLQNHEGDTALMVALKNNAPSEVLQALVRGKVDLNVQNKKGKTALILGIEQHRYLWIKECLNEGARTDGVDHQGDSLLVHAIKHRMIEVINDLIKAGVSVMRVNDKKQTVLMHAVEVKEDRLVDLFLDMNVPLDAQDMNGETALMYAVRQKDAKLCYTLLEKGCCWSIKNHQSFCARDLAVQEGLSGVVEWMDHSLKENSMEKEPLVSKRSSRP